MALLSRNLLIDSQNQDENAQAETTNDETPKLPIKGADGVLISFAKCCRPIPGDPIVAYWPR